MIHHVLTFTLLQALSSTIVSLGLGLFLARLFFMTPMPWLERSLSLPLIMPSLSLVTGLTALVGYKIFEMNALISITIAHAVLNIPLVMMILLNAYRSIPSAHWQLSMALKLPPVIQILKLELPLLQGSICQTAGIILLLCFSSFTIPLMLGGGPDSNTLTLSLYYNLVIKGDYNESMLLLLIKIISGFIIVLIFNFNTVTTSLSTGKYRHYDFKNDFSNKSIMIGFVLILLAPIAALIIQQDWMHLSWSQRYTEAILGSLTLAIFTATITIILTLSLCFCGFIVHNVIEKISALLIVIPSFVIATALLWIQIHYNFMNVSAFTILLIINCLHAWPMALRLIYKTFKNIANNHQYLMIHLHLPLTAQLRWIYLPLLWPTLRLSFALVAIYSLSDLGSILCFPSQDIITLPKIIHEAYSQFDLATAQWLSLILLALSTFIFMACTGRIHNFSTKSL